MFKQRNRPGARNQSNNSGPPRIKESKIFVKNLPLDIKEEEMTLLFKDFGVKSVRKFCYNAKSYGFLELASPEIVQRAIQQMNGILVKGRRITVAIAEDQRPHRRTKNDLPDLEPIPLEEFSRKDDLVPKANSQVPAPLKQVSYAVPMEMRSAFLLQMLKDCFKEEKWLFSIACVLGKVALLVTDTIPQTPYFWAIHLTQECQQKMQNLFCALAKVESQLPFVTKQEAHQGARCLAECIVGSEGSAWNRCWVLDTVEDLAVVFFVDFGHSATVPLKSLRKLERDEFWDTGPLAQPFMLHEEAFPPQMMLRHILEGTVVGPSQRQQQHILTFCPQNPVEGN